MAKPSPKKLRALIAYNPLTGVLRWKPRTPKDFPADCGPSTPEQICDLWNSKWAGKEAFGYLSKRGYKVGNIRPHTLSAHRVAWAIYFYKWPDGQIDHINGDRTDNRIDNLREVTNAENAKNMRRKSTNKSGTTGVFFAKHVGKWTAQITVNGRGKHLGLFVRKRDAIAARKKAEAQYGYHANHGK